MSRRDHWEQAYRTKGERDVSWFEPLPDLSLRLIEHAGVTPATCVLDVGGGDARLVDALLARGLTCLAVLDISEIALARARVRLGAAATRVRWVVADVTADWVVPPMDIWHDRATFHFLTNADDREAYRRHLRQTLRPRGAAVIATFALDGPVTCSGLPVVRYSPDTLAAELGPDFHLIDALAHTHHTPHGATQTFQYSLFRRV